MAITEKFYVEQRQTAIMDKNTEKFSKISYLIKTVLKCAAGAFEVYI